MRDYKELGKKMIENPKDVVLEILAEDMPDLQERIKFMEQNF